MFKKAIKSKIQGLLLAIVILLVVFAASFVLLFAHSGRTDRYGGHHNRKTGGYHYHNAGYVHDSNNPYQDHENCGVCTKQKATTETEVRIIKNKFGLEVYQDPSDGKWYQLNPKNIVINKYYEQTLQMSDGKWYRIIR